MVQISLKSSLVYLITFLLLSIFNSICAQDDSKDQELSKALIGTWIYQDNLNGEDVNSAIGNRIKSFTGKHWQINQSDPHTGRVIFHHGGTYEINDGIVITTTKYANSNTFNLVGSTNSFTMKVEDNTLTQTGIDNKWDEIWIRID
ncbi:hypothetical protein GH721_05525 [Kriegella sp. EG-1]|nr:hypothetical protein [Flavobacteriaceae bacterium EG-1]